MNEEMNKEKVIDFINNNCPTRYKEIPEKFLDDIDIVSHAINKVFKSKMYNKNCNHENLCNLIQHILPFISERLRDMDTLMYMGLSVHNGYFEICSERLRNDKTFIKTAFELNGLEHFNFYSKLSYRLQHDKDFILELLFDDTLKVNPQGCMWWDMDRNKIPKFFIDESTADKDILYALIKRGLIPLYVVPKYLKDDKEFVLKCMEYKSIYFWSSNILKKDVECIKKSLEKYGFSLQYMPEYIKDDLGYVSIAIKNSGLLAYQYASERIRMDRNILLRCNANYTNDVTKLTFYGLKKIIPDKFKNDFFVQWRFNYKPVRRTLARKYIRKCVMEHLKYEPDSPLMKKRYKLWKKKYN